MNLFDKVKCKGFYKKVKDGIWVHLDKTTLTAYAMNSNLIDIDNDGTMEADIDCVEKTYYEHVKGNFSGVIVGFKDLVIKGYLDVNYQDAVDVGVGTIPEKFYVDKRPKQVVKCAIVYYANNMKHFVPITDIEETTTQKEVQDE